MRARIPFMRILVAAALLVMAGRAQAECTLVGQPWLEARMRGQRRTARAVDARLGQEIEVLVAARVRSHGRSVTLSDAGRAWAEEGCTATVAWHRVEPRMQHVTTPPPNKDVAVYANAVVFGPDHGKWIGYDTIEYVTSPVDGGGTTRLVRDARPSPQLVPPRPPPDDQLGTLRLSADVTVGGKTLATAPLRYSFRSSDGFLGWLTAFYNVPYVFGSAGKGARNQAERFVGADCADILVAALRKTGKRIEYSSVGDLVDALERVGPPAAPDRTLRVGRDVRPGDLLALDYVGFDGLPRAWDHIVVVVEDRGPDGRPDGVLGPEDIVADSGDASGLKKAPLADQGSVRIQVLRISNLPVL